MHLITSAPSRRNRQQWRNKMAYVSQDFKKEVAPVVKALLKKYKLKGSLSVHNHSTLLLTITQGQINFLKDSPHKYISINPYWLENSFSGQALEFLQKAVQALKASKYFDHSDGLTDYFHCSHYINITIGKWNKPYQLI